MTDLSAEHILEIFNERAAIMEFDANMPRAEAERAAWLDMRKLYGIFKMPDEMQKLLKK